MDLTQDAESQSEEAVTDPEQLHQELLEFSNKFKDSISQVIIGQQEILDQLVVALFCRGHVLITGVPGLAKTLLIRSLAQLFHLKFNRIQCTPDLMPSDITGVEILEESGTDRSFRFIPGPVFTNLLLADEINRTSPRTQAALLQAMQEQEVTVSGQTRTLEDPFIVFATQNPIDSEGTYPLPEAQLDRFLFNIDIRYPAEAEEIEIAKLPSTFDASPLEPIFEPELISRFQNLVNAVPMGSHLVEWVVHFIRETRPEQSRFKEVQELVEWGAGVRASQNIVRAARARAVLEGSSGVRPEHIRAILLPVLRHRIILNFSAEAEQWTTDRLIEWLIERIPFS
ncbi:MAG: MoxR family ATPase [SAR324 cluster bacterium]|nr:MoxR family ATPase [SAR324 cluster bacterium]